jgi:hypothetical protein
MAGGAKKKGWNEFSRPYRLPVIPPVVFRPLFFASPSILSIHFSSLITGNKA